MTETLTLKLTDMAYGGAAIGRDGRNRVIFVPYGVPDETVQVEIIQDKGGYAHARLQRVVQPSPDRLLPVCPHFGVCSGCHWQQISYQRQLALKERVLRDQLERIGKIKLQETALLPIIANPEPYHYQMELTLSPTSDGQMGLWSAVQQQVVPIKTCYLVSSPLQDLLADLDLELPTLRKISLRLGDDDALLAALETTDIEPPDIVTDLPISLAIVLPNRSAANLIGDNYIVRTVLGRDFRVSAGTPFPLNRFAAEKLVETILHFAQLAGKETVLELYSGVGLFTAFLSAHAQEVIAVEASEDAVADMAVNLAEVENVTVYQGVVEEIVPALPPIHPHLLLLAPPEDGLAPTLRQALTAQNPSQILYISHNLATFARDARQFAQVGYQLTHLQPIDMQPQTFHILTVAHFQKTEVER